MLLVKNAEIYAPEYLGKKDLLICGGKIECIQDSIRELPVECEVLDAEGKILTPGFLDQHVHITGGGGEGSFHTRTPELQMSELVENSGGTSGYGWYHQECGQSLCEDPGTL